MRFAETHERVAAIGASDTPRFTHNQRVIALAVGFEFFNRDGTVRDDIDEQALCESIYAAVIGAMKRDG